jgi:hypothetical protein
VRVAGREEERELLLFLAFRGPRLLVTSAQDRGEREQQGQERPDRAYELRAVD